ncbi:MAG: hypothetical protein LBK54_11885 [Propionibacteriaceae bacterium]|nr:hypothetical protein [Propionibacteriaceae bacterium]
MSTAQTPKSAGLQGLPDGPGARRRPLTKPVRKAAQRPTPRWVGWVLISLPSLALLGSWLFGRLPVLAAVVAVLAVTAAWDWWRFQDHSRTIWGAGGLGLGFLVSAGVALAVSRPPLGPALDELMVVVYGWALTVSLIQLYRTGETVLTLIRGWMYMVGILGVIAVYMRLTRDWPLSGPLPSPSHLATAGVIGVALMPIGYALESDRRLRWTYPVAAVIGLGVIWWTHQSVALGLALILLALWATQWRPGRWGLAGAALVGLGLALSPLRRHFPLHWSDVGLYAPLPWSARSDLIDQGMAMLKDSSWLGVGPAGFAWRLRLSGDPVLSLTDRPYNGLIEVASQYGLALIVVMILAGLGALRWCWRCFSRTRGRPVSSAQRAPAFWLAGLIIGLPLISSIQPSWLDAPLSSLVVATLGLLIRHVEPPKGRRVTISERAWLPPSSSPASPTDPPASPSDLPSSPSDPPGPVETSS